MFKFLLFSFFCGLASAVDVEKPFYNLEHAEHYFNDFVQTYNKQYDSENEKGARLKIFTENLMKLNEMNSVDSAIYSINQFSDLSGEEFSDHYKGFVQPPEGFTSSCKVVTDGDITTKDAPESFDWRQKNKVTPVKNQGRCGSCYAFSSAGNIESINAIHGDGQLLDLAEQQLVSCSQENLKCMGGFMTTCMMDVIDAGGIELESDYPYKNSQDNVEYPCSFKKELAKVKLSGCLNFNLTDEEKLKQALFQNGPISIAVASQGLHGYHGGIISHCPGTRRNIDHAVLLVGYGIDSAKGPFWIIKNSWATNWGEQGYFRITRGHNSCVLMNDFMASAVIG